MRTPARAERDLIARWLAPIAIAAAACMLFATLFVGCEGPGLEPPAHDRNNGRGPSAGGTLPPPTMTGGSGGTGGSFGNPGGHAGSGTTGTGGAGGKGSDAGSTPDMTPKPDAGPVPELDAGRDEDAGVD
jgi:hypothetical protein